MKNSKLKFRMAARCEAAGRPANEDNYQLDEDLSDDRWGFTADREVDLGSKGALLLVCDGMGGMNAGEVASAIAVDTVKQFFWSDRLTDSVLANPSEYIVTSITAADTAIKNHCKENPETAGMGSTIVLAWLLGSKVYVGWCGDSRCYCYNPANGLVRLSRDHSYVQELVDAGKLSEDLAFDHPNSNIITRSLGDPNGTARPDVCEYDLHDNDIIMLCSDGLCGCLRDSEIESQISMHLNSMQECRDALWNADEVAGWHDNVTIAIAQILSGGVKAVQSMPSRNFPDSKATLLVKNRRLKIILIFLLLLIFVVVGVAAFVLFKPAADDNGKSVKEKPETASVEPKTDISVQTIDRKQTAVRTCTVVRQEINEKPANKIQVITVAPDEQPSSKNPDEENKIIKKEQVVLQGGAQPQKKQVGNKDGQGK